MEHLLIPLLFLCCLALAGLLLWSWISRAIAAATINENNDILEGLHREAIEDGAKLKRLEENRDYFKDKADILEVAQVRHQDEILEIGRRADAHMAEWKKTEELRIRKDAKARSKSIVKGLTQEHFAPFWIAPDLDPRDFRFVGDPVDYVICRGASAVSKGLQDHVDEVILMDVKTGKAQLSKVQRRIRDAINEGRVRFAVYNPDKEQELELQKLLANDKGKENETSLEDESRNLD